MLLDLASDIESVIQLIEMMLNDEVENYKLEQINVVSDDRNNKFVNMKEGKFIIDIYYKHKIVLNITHLSYTVQKLNNAKL